MNELRIGLVGTQRGGFVPRACRVLGRMRVTAVFDVNADNAQGAAAEIDGCRAYGPGEWEAFIESGVNAVIIASPVPFHVEQSVDCLARGLHVLCEVVPARTLDKARQLVRATAASSATYMLAENCCFLDAAELFARLVREGVLGDTFYAEGGYLHDCRSLWRNPDGSLTWRGQGNLGVYCTHPLGPILDILQDRVTQVSSLATPRARMEAGLTGENNHLMLMKTAAGRSVFVRIDHMSPQPYQCYFHIQGSRGVCAYTYGMDEFPRICLDGGHQWETAEPFLQQYLPERLNIPDEARELGHGSMEYWMMKAWADALLDGQPLPIDVHRGLDYTLPGIIAAESSFRGGETLSVPDSRAW
ncbi:MAG: Gfo/Idh/MocA family protein [Armatimonadota bacterium]